MVKRTLYILSFLLLLIACSKEEEATYVGKPVMRLTLTDSTDVSVEVAIQTLNANEVYLSCLESEITAPDASSIISEGVRIESDKYVFTDLSPETDYTVYGVCIREKDIVSKVYTASVTTEEAKKPSVTINVESVQNDQVVVSITKKSAHTAYAMLRKSSDAAPTAETIIEEGIEEEGGKVVFKGIVPNTRYMIYAVGVTESMYGKVVRLSFTAPLSFWWEDVREEPLTFADLDLLSGGHANKTPKNWDEDRLKPHVTFTDENGKEQWLHEAFLFIGGVDDRRNMVLCIDEGKKQSGDQLAWKDFADYWLADGGVLSELDKTIDNAISRIGAPAFKHKVVITMPDPIMLEYFHDKKSSTTYWGEAEGRQLDFNSTYDQVLAYKWYINYVREQWALASPEHIELAGFYILSEILVAKPSGWNYNYKRWDKIIPYVSEYLHELKYTLNWIPYYQADGYDMTEQLGIDYTWIQPGKYWDYPERKTHKKWSWVFNTMDTYGHGMEIEFEGTHGESGWSGYESGVPRTSASILETVRTDYDAQGTPKGSPNPQAARNKQLLRDYMNEFRNAGYYGKARIATYSGTNAMYELATSPDRKDQEMYLEYCKFIVENPLRK